MPRDRLRRPHSRSRQARDMHRDATAHRAGDTPRHTTPHSKGRSHRQRHRPGARRAAHTPHRLKALPHAAAGAGGTAHRDTVAQSRLQQRLRILPRSEEHIPRHRPRGVDTQADPRTSRAVHHTRAERVRDKNPHSRDTHTRDRAAHIHAPRRGPQDHHPRDTARRLPHSTPRLPPLLRHRQPRAPLHTPRHRRHTDHRHTRRPPPRHRDTDAARRGLHTQRHTPRRHHTADNHHHRPQHVRQVSPAAPDSPHHAHGTDRMLRPRRERPHRHRRQDIHTRRGQRQHSRRRVDIHGRDDRGSQYPQQRHQPLPRPLRRARPRHIDLRRHIHSMGHRRVPPRESDTPHTLRHTLP